jgi:hypothetical protein
MQIASVGVETGNLALNSLDNVHMGMANVGDIVARVEIGITNFVKQVTATALRG